MAPVPVAVTVTVWLPTGVPGVVLPHPARAKIITRSRTPRTTPKRRRRFLEAPVKNIPKMPRPLRPSQNAGEVCEPWAGGAAPWEAVVAMVSTVMMGRFPLATTEAGAKVQVALAGKPLQAKVMVPV